MQILIVALLMGLIPVEIFKIFNNFNTIFDYIEIGLGWNANSWYYLFDIIRGACIVVLCIVLIICVLKKTNFFNFTRLTYEQYKEKRLQNQADKKQAKIEKLKSKLTEIEKD